MAEAAKAQVDSINAADQWHKRLEQYAVSVGKNMGNAMTEWITGEKTASQALADFAKDLIRNALQLMAQWVGVYTMLMAFGLANPHMAAQGATKAVLGVDLQKKATGGYITGPGTGTSDSIPAMLSNGEFVIRSAAVDRIGLAPLEALNAGRIPEFSDGGSVDDTIAATTGGDNITLQVSAIDAASFAGFLDRYGLRVIKQALKEDNRRFGTESGVF